MPNKLKSQVIHSPIIKSQKKLEKQFVMRVKNLKKIAKRKIKQTFIEEHAL